MNDTAMVVDGTTEYLATGFIRSLRTHKMLIESGEIFHPVIFVNILCIFHAVISNLFVRSFVHWSSFISNVFVEFPFPS